MKNGFWRSPFINWLLKNRPNGLQSLQRYSVSDYSFDQIKDVNCLFNLLLIKQATITTPPPFLF